MGWKGAPETLIIPVYTFAPEMESEDGTSRGRLPRLFLCVVFHLFSCVSIRHVLLTLSQ